MAATPSWVKQFDKCRPRSQSVQSTNQEYWDLAQRDAYQPLKWRPDYNLSNTSSQRNDNNSYRQPVPRPKSAGNLASLYPIPENHTSDRDRSFHSGSRISGIQNPVFELSDFSVSDRRFSDGDILSGRYQKRPQKNDVGNYRRQRSDSEVESNRRRNAQSLSPIESDGRSEVRSERSEGRRSDHSARSAKSGKSSKSGSVASEQSSETLLSPSRKSQRRKSEIDTNSQTSSQRATEVGIRKSVDLGKSASVSSIKQTTENQTASAFAHIEIPVDFLESPATRLKKLLGPAIMCILVVTLAASLGAAIYFATVLKDKQEEHIDLLRAHLEMGIKGAGNSNRIDNLSDQEVISLKESYCKQMDIFFKDSKLYKETYKGCEVISITNNKISFTLLFDEKEANEKDIVNVIEKHAQRVGGTTARLAMVDKLKVDLDTATIKLERDNKAEETPVKSVEVQKEAKKTFTPSPVVTNKPVTVPPTLPALAKHTTEPRPATTTSVPKPRENNPCEGRNGNFLAHPNECNLYYQCVNGKKVLFACGGKMVFDIAKKVCVQKAPNMKACMPHTPIAIGFDWGTRDPWDPCQGSEGDYFPHPGECNLFFQCSHNMSIVRVCQSELVYDWKQKICLPKTDTALCQNGDQAMTKPAETKITAPTRPPKQPQSQSSPKTSTLRPIVYPTRPAYDRRPCKSAQNGDSFPHPDDCRKYIRCKDGVEKDMSCSDGLVFDPAILTCVRPSGELPCVDLKPCKGLNQGYFPHPVDCNKFIVCEGGKEIIQTCLDGNVWNAYINRCVRRETYSMCPKQTS